MVDTKSVIGPAAFKEVLTAGGVKKTTIRHTGNGLVLVLLIGGQERVLGQYRGGPRYFSTVDGAVSVLIQHGIYEFEANVLGWLPKTLARKAKAPFGDGA